MTLPFFRRLLIAGVLLLLGAAAGRAEVFEVPGARIHFEPPAGLCSLEPERNERDRALFDMQADILKTSNRLLTYVVDCEMLPLWRTDPSAGPGDYGLFMLPLSDGGLRRFETLTRERFLDEMERVYADVGTADLRAALDDVGRRVLDELAIGEIRSIGVLDRNDDAIFVRLVGSFDDGGSTYTLAVLMATTLLAGYPASFNLYTAYVDDATFEDLLERQREFASLLVRLNDADAANATVGTPAGGGFDWMRILRHALIGAIVGALLAAAILIWRRRRGEG